MSSTAAKLTRACSVLGLIVSLYAVYVEYKMAASASEEEPADFVALCDIESIGASCSAVFALPEGHLLSYFGLVERHSDHDIPNALIGSVYYAYMLFLSAFFPLALTRVAVNMAFATTVFLAYQLTVNVKELCLVCWTTHVLNALLWYTVMFGQVGNNNKKQMTTAVKKKK